MSLVCRGRAWLAASLGRRVLATLAVVLVSVSLPVLAVVTALYFQRIEAEQVRASAQFNEVVEAALKNAMLKRDLPGMQAVFDDIAASPEIESVMVVSPDFVVRLGDSAAPRGQVLDEPLLARAMTSATSVSTHVTGPDGQRLLRSVKAVHNRPECHECHGSVADHPINGLLVLDYSEGGATADARRSAAWLAAMGLLVTLTASAAVWLTIRRTVERPLARLTAAVRSFRDGATDTGFDLQGSDEISELGRSFVTMAGDLGQTLARLHESEDRLQAILDAIPDAVRVIGPDYRIVKANAAYAAQVGQPLDHVVGDFCYRSSHRRDAPCPMTLVCCPLEALKGAARPMTCRQTQFSAQGREIHVEVAAAPVILDPTPGARPHVVESIRDLEREAELGQEHRLSELGLLAAGLGHEIFNPLSSISLVAGAIEQDAASGDMNRLNAHLSTLQREVERTLVLTNSLLTLCQPPGEQQFVDLAQVVPQTLELLGFKAREAMVEMVIDLAPGLWIIASESDLRMSLSNLVLNGIHSMPGGGQLTVTARRDGAEVRIQVVDTGHGISADDLRRILLPFWTRRADGSRGSGLGLPLVLAAMERANGRLEVESAPGVGSRFSLVFPGPEART